MLDPEELVEITSKLEEPLKEYLEWKQVVNRLERGKHAKLAEIQAKLHNIDGDGKFKSVARLEMEALASPAYNDFLKQLDEAEGQMVKWQVKVDTLNNRFSALQSYFAYQRDHFKKFGA